MEKERKREDMVRALEAMVPTIWGCVVKVSSKVGYPHFAVPGIQVGHHMADLPLRVLLVTEKRLSLDLLNYGG